MFHKAHAAWIRRQKNRTGWLLTLFAFVGSSAWPAHSATAQSIVTCRGQLMITMHNTTEFSYELKLDGIALGRLAPGQHLHVRRQHGRMLIEAVPVSKGLKYSQWLDSHADFVWQLETPRVVSPPAPDKQPRANQSKPKQQSAPTGHVTRNGFYTQFENAGGIMIKAPACVRPQALQEAKRVVERVLQNGPELHKRLAGQGLEIVVFGAKQKITDLPETTHLKGKPCRALLAVLLPVITRRDWDSPAPTVVLTVLLVLGLILLAGNWLLNSHRGVSKVAVFGRLMKRFIPKFLPGRSADRAADSETQGQSTRGAYYVDACAGLLWLTAYVPTQQRLRLLLEIGQQLGSPLDVKLASTHHEDGRLRQWRESLAFLKEFWMAYYTECDETCDREQPANRSLGRLKAEISADVKGLMATTEFCKSMQPRVFRSPRVEFAVMADVLSRYEPVVAADYHTEISLQSCSEPLSYVQLTPAKIFHIWHDDQNYAPFEQVLKVAGLEYVINLELREESRHDAHLELADNRFRDPFESLVSAIGAREQTGTAS